MKYKDNSMSRDLAHGYHHQLTLGQKTVGKRMPRVADDETFVSDSWTSICRISSLHITFLSLPSLFLNKETKFRKKG